MNTSVYPERAGAGTWLEYAACRGVDPELFFPGRGRSSNAEAKRVCAGCPVRVQCLNYSLDNGEKYGVWGGVSEKERRRLRVLRNRAAA